mgnify:CR=1 FL=1
MLTPARRRGHEILDDPSVDPALSERSLRDIALANRMFGGRRAILREVRRSLHAAAADGRTLLDIGTGLGDIPHAAEQMVRDAHRRRHGAGTSGGILHTIGLEVSTALARVAHRKCRWAVTGDGTALPFADHSIDIVTCSQVLHHFDDRPAEALLRECHRVARHAVVIGDLRRSWLAIGGLWLSSFALGFHPVSRHDGVVSIRRGYTRRELARLIERAVGVRPVVRHSLGWRVTACWSPDRSLALT